MVNKYSNYDKYFFIKNDDALVNVKVNRYVTEGWNFDGQFFNKTTDHETAKAKIPQYVFTIEEFLNYVDNLVAFRNFVFENKPKKGEFVTLSA